tara:strand:- start:74 stop:280 length:207 start_codon:yes stop_codon:yes gene_type:complete
MGFNKKNTDTIQDNVNINENLIARKTIENLNSLYPNGQRITHTMRWFKGIERGLRNDIAAKTENINGY